MSIASYFDGDRAEPFEVRLTVRSADDMLVMEADGRKRVQWPLGQVRRVSDQAGRDQTVLRWIDDPLARLVVNDRSILRMFPALDKRAPPSGRWRLAGWAGAAVLAVAVQVFVLIPALANQLADLIPPAGERALGKATLGQIQEILDETGLGQVPICEAPEGVAALDKMGARLMSHAAFEQDPIVLVLDHSMVNAFALPGGYVVFFRGLIDAAETPEEVAAVFAHELGHVVSRDPTRHALRSAGSIGVLGLLLGDFAGGAAVLFLAEQLINAQYTQGAEAAADDFASDLLLRADLSPAALGDFFERLREKHGDSDGFVSHFMSHPALGDRIQAARSAVPSGAAFRPVLSQQEWQALRGICR